MKKLLLIVFILSFQNDINAGNSMHSISLSAGLNFTNLNYNNLFYIWEDTQYKFNYNFATLAEYQMAPALSIQTGLRYSVISNKVNIDPDIYDSSLPEDYVKQDYFNMSHRYIYSPLLVKYSFHSFINPYLLTGLEFGYLLSASSESHFSDNSVMESDHLNQLNRLNIAFDFGIGFEKKINSYNYFVSFLYSHGLLDIPKKDDWLMTWKSKEFYTMFGISYIL